MVALSAAPPASTAQLDRVEADGAELEFRPSKADRLEGDGAKVDWPEVECRPAELDRQEADPAKLHRPRAEFRQGKAERQAEFRPAKAGSAAAGDFAPRAMRSMPPLSPGC